jgi:hypothetical protein
MEDKIEIVVTGRGEEVEARKILRKIVWDLDEFFFGRMMRVCPKEGRNHLLSVSVVNHREEVIVKGFLLPPNPFIDNKVFSLAVEGVNNWESFKPGIKDSSNLYHFVSQPILFCRATGKDSQPAVEVYGFALCVDNPHGSMAWDVAKSVIARAQVDYTSKYSIV